jgi:hypothetical protein
MREVEALFGMPVKGFLRLKKASEQGTCEGVRAWKGWFSPDVRVGLVGLQFTVLMFRRRTGDRSEREFRFAHRRAKEVTTMAFDIEIIEDAVVLLHHPST